MLSTVTDFAARWVDVLVQESLNASIVFGVVMGLSFLLRRRGPAVHLALWSLVFVRLVLPADLAHPWSIGELVQKARTMQRQETPISAIGYGVWEALPLGAVSGTADAHSEEAFPWRTGVAIFWLVGFAAAGYRFGRQMRVFEGAVKRAVRNDRDHVLELVDRWRQLLGVRRTVTVVTSDEAVPPFTIGIVRPVIFLPSAVAEDSQTLEPVVAHEMAHVARFDALWLRLQHYVQMVYFFHPLVWISGVRLNSEREKLCDATAVAAGRMAARDYVGGLLNVLRLDLQGAGAPTMTARKRRIEVRIQNIFERNGGNRPRLVTAIAAACAVGVFLLPVASDGGVAEPTGNSVSEATVSDESVNPARTDYANPLPGGRITRSWGSGHLDPFTGKEVFHRGIDVAAKTGTPVYVAAAGMVAVATDDYEPQPGAGMVVIVDHGNGMSTYYGHLSSFAVEEGQKVAQGDVIANVGSTGKSTGPHLHFEVRSDDEFLNPADFVDDWKRARN